MNSKMLLLSIAVVSVGLFAMPSTLSMFSGQHTFDKAGNTSVCAKCHSDVYIEIQGGSYHKSLIDDTTYQCKGCHTSDRINSSLIYAGNRSASGAKYNYTTSTNLAGLDLTTGKFIYANSTDNATGYNFGGGIHSAVIVECVWCHGAVNMTNDAHSVFQANSSSATQLSGSNELCVGCHTKALYQFNWVRKGGFNYTYDFANHSGTFVLNATNANSTTNNTG